MSDERERRGYDRDLARLLSTMFGTGATRGLDARVYDLERDATKLRAEVDIFSAAARAAELRARDFADHPLLNKDVARRVVDHIVQADHETADRRTLMGRVQGQVIILAFSVMQTLILAWVAVHLTGARFPLP